jgi:hypothetical protein
MANAHGHTFVDVALCLTGTTETDLKTARPLLQDATDPAGDARAKAILVREFKKQNPRRSLQITGRFKSMYSL